MNSLIIILSAVLLVLLILIGVIRVIIGLVWMNDRISMLEKTNARVFSQIADLGRHYSKLYATASLLTDRLKAVEDWNWTLHEWLLNEQEGRYRDRVAAPGYYLESKDDGQQNTT